MSKIGRNDPCPCGSGKKYKKCCMLVHDVGIGGQPDIPGNAKQNDDFIPIDVVADYGHPFPNEAFFAENDLHELSAPRLIHSSSLRSGYYTCPGQTVLKKLLILSSQAITERLMQFQCCVFCSDSMITNTPKNYYGIIITI